MSRTPCGRRCRAWPPRRRPERTLTGLAVLIQSNALVAALSPYTLEGAYGRLLDGASEQLATTDVLHFEMEAADAAQGA